MRFDPNPLDVLVLPNDTLTVQPLPDYHQFPFACEGAKGVVYKVANGRRTQKALKVFLEQFRSVSLVKSSMHLKNLSKLRGLRAARRQVLSPSDARVAGWPDLEYAVLMPWIKGRTWHDILLEAQRGVPLDEGTSELLAKRFLDTVASMEANGYAHCDLSAGNVVVGMSERGVSVQLVDLEDVFGLSTPNPNTCLLGTAGYQHRARHDVWRAEGDRYSAAVLAAEMLILSAPELARRASDRGYFCGSAEDPEAQRRWDAALPWLRWRAPAFCALLERAWTSSRLEDCPSVRELALAMSTIVRRADPPKLATASSARVPTTVFVPFDMKEIISAHQRAAPAETRSSSAAPEGGRVGAPISRRIPDASALGATAPARSRRRSRECWVRFAVATTVAVIATVAILGLITYFRN